MILNTINQNSMQTITYNLYIDPIALYYLELYSDNFGDFHALWWVLMKNDLFWHVIIVVIFMYCGGF